MDLYNPYEKPEVSQDFPYLLAVAFGISIFVLIGAFWVLWIRGKKDSKMRAKIPEWVLNITYPAFFLLLPFVMLISTMLFFPCWWQRCPEEGAAVEQVQPVEQEKESVW